MTDVDVKGGLEITGLVAGYLGQPALHSLELSVPRGVVCAVVGPNGAGKTTLVRCLIGSLPAWRGSIRWDGVELSRSSARTRVRAGISVVPQGAATFPRMTVVQNLVIASRINAKGSAADASVDEVLEIFPELAERPGLLAGDLSGGQRQMLAIGRAMSQKPRLLLVDEPSFGLAVGVRHRVVETLRRFRDDSAGTVLIVEQDANVIKQLADDVWFMASGTLERITDGNRVVAS